MPNILGVIPARAGSVDVPGKNLRKVGGISLLERAVMSAHGCPLLTDTVITTDIPEAQEFRNQVSGIISRPPELAGGSANSVRTTQHAVRAAKSMVDYEYDYICLIQCTSPLRQPIDIQRSLEMLTVGAVGTTGTLEMPDSVLSVTRLEDEHPERCYSWKVDDYLEPYLHHVNSSWPVDQSGLRQLLEPVYLRNGAVYACTRDLIMNHDTFIGSRCLPYIMPRSRSVNIDVESDLVVAEAMMKALDGGDGVLETDYREVPA